MDVEIRKLVCEHAIMMYNFYDGLAKSIERATTDADREILAHQIRDYARDLLSVPQGLLEKKHPDVTDEEREQSRREYELEMRSCEVR